MSVDFGTDDGTAIAGTDYEAASGTLQWAENDASAKTITIAVKDVAPFSGVHAFQVVLTNPSGNGAKIGSPGTANVAISGAASTGIGSIELSDGNYPVAQNTGSVTVTVNRTGGSVGAVSVAYSTTNGTALSGTDYTAASGVLEWADGDASSKTFDIAISTSKAFSGNRTFSVALSDPRSGVTLGSPSSALVTISGSGSAAAGSFQLTASSYTVAQSTSTLKISVSRVSGSSGAVSVAYATANGTAMAGTDYTAAKGTLNWADGDTAVKTFTVAISNGAAFSGARNFKVALSNPSSKASIASPGTAIVTINGDATAAAGSLELARSTYSVEQSTGSVTVTVNRTGGSAGAASVGYGTRSGTAVAGTDFTATSGTLQWADGDAAPKTFLIPVNGTSVFSGTRSFSVALNGATGSTLGSPVTASIGINGAATAAIGNLQLSSANFTVLQSAGNLTVTVNRTGGSSGSISVKYATANGTAVAGTDYTAANGTLQWADGDAASKSFPIAISNANGFSGSRNFTVVLSGPTAGASLSSPSSAAVTITGSAAGAGAGSTFWVFRNGVFSWGGDYSFSAIPNYKDTTGNPQTGPYDIAVSVVGRWGGYQPYAGGTVPHYAFDDRGYQYLVFDLKPTVANQVWHCMFHSVGDVAIGQPLRINNYGPAPVVGKWATYKIPLSDLGVLNTTVYKFFIQDTTGLPTNLFYVDNVGFTAN